MNRILEKYPQLKKIAEEKKAAREAEAAAELAAIKTAKDALQYIHQQNAQYPDTQKKRFRDLEHIILQDAECAFNYVCMFSALDNQEFTDGGRWPEAEPLFIQRSDTAGGYARWILGRRWPEAEEIIAQDSHQAAYYAYSFFRNQRWLLAEPALLQDAHWTRWYLQGIGVRHVRDFIEEDLPNRRCYIHILAERAPNLLTAELKTAAREMYAEAQRSLPPGGRLNAPDWILEP